MFYTGNILSISDGTYTTSYAYDANGTPLTVTWNGAAYYYVTNLQGDVVAILNTSGSPVVQYAYDAWGKQLGISGSMATTLGTYNPLRYRGYVYDTETGFYYLQSRYYNPALGRFLNADAFTATGQGLTGNNMFAYCGNNPVNRNDKAGERYEVIDPSALGGYGGGFSVASLLLPFAWLADIFGGTKAEQSANAATVALAKTKVVPKTEEKAESIVIPKKSDRQVYFPLDPNDFNPMNLNKVVRPGSTNGVIINWMDPKTNTEVFRWDENPNKSNGPHYHINDPIYINAKVHFYPEDPVPEPYATIYFPFR